MFSIAQIFVGTEVWIPDEREEAPQTRMLFGRLGVVTAIEFTDHEPTLHVELVDGSIVTAPADVALSVVRLPRKVVL